MVPGHQTQIDFQKESASLAALEPDRHVILYTRAGCHLCEEANEVLQSFSLIVELVDIDKRPELLAEYNECVPVVEMDGKVRFRGSINRLLLRRLLQNKNA